MRKKLLHGGRLQAAAKYYRRPVEEWLDLSAALNPHAYPLPELPPSAWLRLPEAEDGLEKAAREYYGVHAILPLAGSQAAIQALPALLPPGRVAVHPLSYAEHAWQWQRNGHRVEPLGDDLPPLDHPAAVLVIVHPDNPSGRLFPRHELLALAWARSASGMLTVIDEAFVDITPNESVAPLAGTPGYEHLIVLRSLGKFFGLAGLRVGFACASNGWLERLGDALGQWTVKGPARYWARKALGDQRWQEIARLCLLTASERLAALLTDHGLQPNGGTALFQWVQTDNAPVLATRLAEQGIMVRHFETPPALRFGLPGDEQEWKRLEQALQSVTDCAMARQEDLHLPTVFENG